MAFGTLDQIGLLANAEEDFKKMTQATLNTNGDSSTLLGKRIPLDIPEIPPDSRLTENLDESPRCTEVMGVLYKDTIDAIDTAFPSGPIPPLVDPTIPVPVDLFVELGLGIEWIEANIPHLVATPPDVMISLAGCDAEPFVDHLIDGGANINKDDAIKKMESACPFPAIPELALPSIGLELPGLDILPVDLEITANFGLIIEGLVVTIGEFLGDIDLAITAMLGGIPSFIIHCIDYFLDAMVALFELIFKHLRTAVLLCAQVITYISKVLGALIVAIAGMLVGAGGLITFGVAVMLGIVAP